MKQHQISVGPLLDSEGNLVEAGFAFSLVKRYNRSSISCSKWRIKEWDYYYVGNPSYGVAFTIDDNGYMSMASISFLDFEHPGDITRSVIEAFPFGKIGLPNDSRNGDSIYENEKKGFSLRFLHQGDKRRLICRMDKFGKKKEVFRCDLTLTETNGKSMVIATPWPKKGHFYYNQKINNLLAGGYCKIGGKVYDFNKDSMGVLDWGRGVWTYKNTWYWSSLNAIQDGHYIGFNLGYGFGDTSKASENMLFFDKEAYKLDDVIIDIPLSRFGGNEFMRPWTFRSANKDINLTFTPVYDRHSDTNLLFLRSNQHQVFGVFNGTISVEGKVFEINGLSGFAEKVFNKW